MSTKIHTGFRFMTENLFEIHEAVAQFRSELGLVRRRKVAAVLASQAVSIIDGHADDGTVHEDVRGSSALSFARREMRRRQKDILASGYRDPEVDFDFELAVMPFRGRVYGMVFTEHQEWTHLWEGCPVVEPYVYWNNSDRPQDVTDAEWEERGRTWSELLLAHPAGSPGMVGFTVQCADRSDLPDPSEVAAEVLPFEQRIEERAKTRVLNELVVAEMAPNAAGTPRCPSDYMSAFVRAERRLATTDDGRSLLEKERSRLRQLLSRVITAEDLTRRLD